MDVRPRPDDLPAAIGWRQVRVTRDIEDITGRDGLITGLVIAHEFLDDVACPVVELDDDLRPRIVQVEAATGTEVLGPDLADPRRRGPPGWDITERGTCMAGPLVAGDETAGTS